MPLLRSLHARPASASAVAAAARSFAVNWLSFDGVLAYLRTLLTVYGELYERGRRASGVPALSATDPAADGYLLVRSEADLQAITGLCERCPRERPKGRGKVRAPPPPLPESCTTAMSTAARHLRTLPRCRLWAPPGGGRCFDERCCIGWDCGSAELGCDR